MKTIVIGDIHNHVDWIEPFLESYPHDSVIFLGDYFDSFRDNAKIAKKTSKWLAGSVFKENRIHLMGNHDMPYRFSNNIRQGCPGFSIEKLNIINKEFGLIDTLGLGKVWDQIKLAHFDHDNNFIFSHAGLSEDIFKCCPINGPNLVDYEKTITDTLEGLNTNPEFISNVVGASGITWIRPEGFKLIPNVTQVVGHTPTWQYTMDTDGPNDGHPIVTTN